VQFSSLLCSSLQFQNLLRLSLQFPNWGFQDFSSKVCSFPRLQFQRFAIFQHFNFQV
jgi:hypothetical protein